MGRGGDRTCGGGGEGGGGGARWLWERCLWETERGYVLQRTAKVNNRGPH